jgi:hypothetical protein
VDGQRNERAVIYALGGGRGHLARARALARRFGTDVPILQQADADAPHHLPQHVGVDAVHAWLREQLRDADWLVVDTFPGGVAHELTDAILRLADRTALVQRYVRPGSYIDYNRLAARFDEVLLPYSPEQCEWEGTKGTYVGPLVRELALEGQADVAVIGASSHMPRRWREALPSSTTYIHGPFDTLPAARRVLTVGAGYNLVYELDALGAKAAHVPLTRRYDDQFRRAGLLGRTITTRAELERFVGHPRRQTPAR